MTTAKRTLNGLRIETKNLADLKAAPYNPRTISQEALNGLAKSLERFGIVEPIIFNERTGHVVGGHQRLKVLEHQKKQQTDVIVVDLELKEEKALNVALNSEHIQGEFDDEKLEALLKEIHVSDKELFDGLRFEEFGFNIEAPNIDDVVGTPNMAFASKFECIVTCKDEAEQRDLYERLQAEGYKVKVLQL